MKTNRIFKPGPRNEHTERGKSAETHSGHSRNGAGHGSEEADDFPLDRLPPILRAMAWAVCETERTPAALAGCCVLGILSASIGRALRVRSGPSRVTKGNLQIIASGESGSGKSETFRHFAQPLFDLERGLVAEWKGATLPGLEAEKDLLEVEIAELKKSGKKLETSEERGELLGKLRQKKADLAALGSSMEAPRLFVENVTTERLAVLLQAHGECLASLSADAGEIVNNLLGRYTKNDRTDEGLYLKAYSGDACRIDRLGRGPVLLESPCLSALWLTQPDKVESLLAERSLTDGGLIPRMLICHTKCEPLEILDDTPAIPEDVARDYRELIQSLVTEFKLNAEIWTIEPSEGATTRMTRHFNATVKKRRADLRDVTSFAARWTENAWRVAVCLHAAKWATEAHERPLDEETAEAAIAIVDWFSRQQLEILSAGRDKARREKWDEVLALLADTPKGIQASDVYRRRIKPNADEAHALLAEMEAAGELIGRDEKPEGGGHVTRIFTRRKMRQ